MCKDFFKNNFETIMVATTFQTIDEPASADLHFDSAFTILILVRYNQCERDYYVQSVTLEFLVRLGFPSNTR
ncbi:hypothetical protein [Leptospira noguchii]|uniref:Uncharacterized protein n=1 Tax=Leptospira noguchii serovar Panama str. CZ214 TaxID=1001595 RepID=T0GVK7_9LEPT|nr:hypothetical protein [Leptospira noguchii]EQA72962.1 hypothetical protein LEP1GSC059_1571 [Leptospira noguchii serovar Panama str. CZ214]